MAASICRSLFNFSALTKPFSNPYLLTSVRYKAKKATGTSRNRRGNPRGKGRGFKVVDGEFVHNGQTLVKQIYLEVYPGQYVDAVRKGDRHTLIALSDGEVMITWEKLNPYPDSPLYQPVQEGVEIVKQFCHIVPVPLHSKFRLVSQV